jgi:hypothetical protein
MHFIRRFKEVENNKFYSIKQILLAFKTLIYNLNFIGQKVHPRISLSELQKKHPVLQWFCSLNKTNYSQSVLEIP